MRGELGQRGLEHGLAPLDSRQSGRRHLEL